MAHPLRIFASALSLFGALTLVAAPDASACGGFFCGRQPVDQTAERILFEVGQDSVTMTTQISFNGRAEDFAWILPLSATPDVNSLAEYPQAALSALDANTGPTFSPPNDPACYEYIAYPPSANPLAADADESGGNVNVEIRAVVGSYEVAVVSSEDPQALIDWLLDNGYRITSAMHPYIERYTEEGLKFLALKLTETAGVEDIKPFRFTLPGTTPTIPLRMTALAAEPEMSIVVFVLGAERFEGKNWANLDIADDQIRFNPFSYSFPIQTNWTKLVAQAVDGAGGQGWVTELAGASEPYAALIRQQLESGFLAPDVQEAATELLASLEAHPYITRLYTRLSAEEMTSDPVLGLSAGGDVDNEHQLSRFVNGVDQCSMEGAASTDPCDYATCGAAGFCRAVPASDVALVGAPAALVAGCACLPGATARPTFAPDGSGTVICQDGRLSFLNPGDRETDTAEALPDACGGFSCGRNGQCVAMNMTPTCVCDQGFVAVYTAAATDAPRSMTCVRPPELVPASFYEGRLPELPAELPGGRQVTITEPMPMPMPDDEIGSGDPTTPDPMASEPPGSFPMPRTNPELGSARRSSSACSLADAGLQTRAAAPWLFALAIGGLGWRRARRARR